MEVPYLAFNLYCDQACIDTSHRLLALESSPDSETSDSGLQLFTTTVVGPCGWFTEIVLCCVSRLSQSFKSRFERLLVPSSSQSKSVKTQKEYVVFSLLT